MKITKEIINEKTTKLGNGFSVIIEDNEFTYACDSKEINNNSINKIGLEGSFDSLEEFVDSVYEILEDIF